MNIPLVIKKLVEQKHFTQEEFARKIGKTKQTVNNYFTGRTKIDIDTLDEIAKALGVPVSSFFSEVVPEDGKKIIQAGNYNHIGIGNGNSNSNASKELETCRKEVEILKARLKDKEEIIELLKGRK
jgi:transcriptional regulator with XRE-family HTH domain